MLSRETKEILFYNTDVYDINMYMMSLCSFTRVPIYVYWPTINFSIFSGHYSQYPWKPPYVTIKYTNTTTSIKIG